MNDLRGSGVANVLAPIQLPLELMAECPLTSGEASENTTGKMTTMQIGKDNCLQISYLKDISAWLSELDRRGMFPLPSPGSAQLSQQHLLVEAGSHCTDKSNSRNMALYLAR